MTETFPYWYPNRAVRRAVKQGRDSRLPSEWKAYLAMHPHIREVIKKV